MLGSIEGFVKDEVIVKVVRDKDGYGGWRRRVEQGEDAGTRRDLENFRSAMRKKYRRDVRNMELRQRARRYRNRLR